MKAYAVPETQRGYVGPHAREPRSRGSFSHLRGVDCARSSVGVVEQHEVSLGPEDARDLSKMFRDRFTTDLHEIRKHVDGKYEVDRVAAKRDRLRPLVNRTSALG